MRPFWNRALAACIALLSLLPVEGTRAAPPSAADARAIDAMVTGVMEKAGVPGLQLYIARGGQVLINKGYGQADLEAGSPVGTDTLFAVGSVTKPMTAFVIHDLVRDGRLSLDRHIGEFVPGLPPDVAAIKLRYLLNHTSGLFNYTEAPALHRESQRPHSPAEMLSWFADKPLSFVPGQGWNYSNSGYYLLGLVIEVVEKRTFAQVMQTRLFDRFGLRHSRIGDSFDIVPGRARGYERGETGLHHAQPYSQTVPFAAGAVLSNAADIAAFLRAVHRPGVGAAAAMPAFRETAQLPDGARVTYALGGFRLGAVAGHEKISHAGDIYGYCAQAAYYPGDDLTIVILSNAKSYMPGPVGLERRIARHLLGIAEPPGDLVIPDAEERKQIIGHYGFGSIQFLSQTQVLADFTGNDLRLCFCDAAGQGMALTFQGRADGRFVLNGDPEISVRFPPGQPGHAILNAYDMDFAMTRRP